MRHQIELFGRRFKIKSEKIGPPSAQGLTPVLAFILLAFGMTLFYRKFPVLIFPALGILSARGLLDLFKAAKFRRVNEYGAVSRPYISTMKSDESPPFIELDKLRKEEQGKA